MNIPEPVEKPAIRLYRPSNGTEGMMFADEFCDQCMHQNPNPEAENPKNCNICMRSFLYGINDPEYPIEWRYDALDHPTCTAFIGWNWDENGDPDDPDNPHRPPPPPDPNQLSIFPLWPNETTFNSVDQILTALPC